ncbi:MAG: response regulator [Magnetococcales bacterium]|nr:response regulator [Magnetococcales bacterium]
MTTFPSDQSDVGKVGVIVGIGASSGGVHALRRFIRAIPAGSGLVFVIFQHLDPTRKSLMVEIAGHWTTLPVEEVRDGLLPRPDHIYLTPPGHLLTFQGATFHLTPLPPSPRHVTPIDTMLTSLAGNIGKQSVGVILSGTGQDGALGLKAIRDAGGVGVVQEPASAEFWNMPKAALDVAGADLLLPPEAMPQALIHWLVNRTTRRCVAMEPSSEPTILPDNPAALLETILEMVSARKGSSLRGYKKSTFQRRVQRRMDSRGIATLAGYHDILTHETAELDRLIRDLLIGVTTFFRDPEAYQSLAQEVIPRLFADKDGGMPVRVWVAGCSSGEEAYSIAMLLLEFQERSGHTHPIQIFATDLDDQALEEGRAGTYDKGIAEDVSPERLERFFTRQGASFHINKPLREACVFALHNLLSDPPFSRIDMIVCRNVLIYMEPESQKQLISVFRFALNPEGYLVLGKTESLGANNRYFDVVSKTWRIFSSRGKVPGKKEMPILNGNPLSRLAAMISPPVTSLMGMEKLCRTILENHGPALVLITRSGEVVYTMGNTREFFSLASGEPSYKIFSLIKPELRSLLRVVLERAVHNNTSATVATRPGTEALPVRITVTSVTSQPGPVFFLVTLSHDPGENLLISEQNGEQFLVQQMEQELQATRDDLQRTIEQLQLKNEELMAYNEEIVAMNEELQSAIEELESSKEELQSLNEELATTNATLDSKVAELEVANSDISNLIGSTDTATIFLDRELRIKRFTAATTQIMRLIPGDVGRPLRDIANSLRDVDLLESARQVLENKHLDEREVRGLTGLWYLMRTIPYINNRQEVDGVVFLFIDISRLKSAEEKNSVMLTCLQEQSHLLSRAHVMAIDLQGRMVFWNQGSEDRYGWSTEEAMGRYGHELLQTECATPLDEIMHMVLQTGEWQGEVMHHARDGRLVALFSHWHLMRDKDGQPLAVVQVNNDISERKQLEIELRQATRVAEAANRSKGEFLASMSHEIRTPMNVVLGMSELLLETSLNTMQRHFVQTMHHSGKAMLGVINDVLDFSRIEAGCITLVEVPFSPRQVVEETAYLMQMVAEQKGLTMHCRVSPEIPVAILGDDSRVRQVLLNLLGNAIKFTQQGSVDFGVMPHAEEPETLLFKVADTGIGIHQEQLEHIFEQFVQAEEGIARCYGGTGLGLTISRRLVTLMGGRIWAESRVGEGSMFCFTLPVRLVDPAALSSAPQDLTTAEPMRALRILLAEDVKENQILFEAYLMSSSHQVVFANDGLEAVERVQKESFDVVIMDVQMPRMDGYSATRRIRQWERDSQRPRLPIIALSAHVMEGEKERSKEAGCDFYLAKPVKRKVLLDALRQIVSQSPAVAP